MIREMRRELARGNREYKSGVFVDVPREKWPAMPSLPLKQVFRSKDFLVQVYEGTPTRLSISRNEIDSKGNWRDGITWDELQSIKDACGFADCDAVEAYPRKADIVNLKNMRHLWIVPAEYATFFWRNGEGTGFGTSHVAKEICGIVKP